jgi:HEAT repeat protein
MCSARRTRGWRSFVTLVVAFGWIAGAQAQAPRVDPVEALRQALLSDKDRSSRGAELTAKVAGLKSLNDFHCALFLSEWRDHHPDPEIAIVDQKYRAIVGKRFEQTLRPILKSSDKALRYRSLEQLDAIAAAQPEGCDPCRLMPALAGDLANMTRHGPPGVREMAAKVLGRWHADPEVAVPALGTLLVVGTLTERVTAASSLTQVIEEASRLARQPNAAADKAVAKRNLILAARGALPALARGTKDKETEVRHLCLVGLTTVIRCSLSAVQADDLVNEDETAEKATAIKGNSLAEFLPLVSSLAEQCKELPTSLMDADVESRSEALQVIEEIAAFRSEWLKHMKGQTASTDPFRDGLVANLPALCRNLNDRDVAIRRKALEALEMFGLAGRASAPNVVRSLNDPDPFVRWAAARTLGRFAPAEAATAIPGLVRLLDETDPGIRLTVVASLERYGPAAKEAVPALLVKAHAQDAEMRAGAIRALAAIAVNSKDVANCVNEALKDPDELVRQCAQVAAERLAAKAKDPAGMLSFHKPATVQNDTAKTRKP